MQNYIPDQNRFHLAGPPVWWLHQLHEFDASLVVIPSRQAFIYRLAQRRKLQLTEKVVNDSLFQHSDTQMLASYGLVPVTSILATANWSNPFLFQELANRAPHRQGGAEAVNARLDADEREDAIKQRLAQNDYQTRLAKDGWNLYLKKIGLRTSMWSPTIKPSDGRIGNPPVSKAPAIIIPK